jgi:hypothetical protein
MTVYSIYLIDTFEKTRTRATRERDWNVGKEAAGHNLGRSGGDTVPLFSELSKQF